MVAAPHALQPGPAHTAQIQQPLLGTWRPPGAGQARSRDQWALGRKKGSGGEKSDGQVLQPVDVKDRTERRVTFPMALRALDRSGWSRPFRGVGPGLAGACCCPAGGGRGRSVASSLAGAICGGRRAGPSRLSGVVQGRGYVAVAARIGRQGRE